MNKILKRLLTGVLTLATVFTALPVTPVHAADPSIQLQMGKQEQSLRLTMAVQKLRALKKA